MKEKIGYPDIILDDDKVESLYAGVSIVFIINKLLKAFSPEPNHSSKFLLKNCVVNAK